SNPFEDGAGRVAHGAPPTQGLCRRQPDVLLDLPWLRMHVLTGRPTGQEEPGVEATQEAGRRYPAGQEDETVEGRRQAQRAQRLSPVLASRQELSQLGCLGGPGEAPAAVAGEQQADLFEEFSYGRAPARVRESPVHPV